MEIVALIYKIICFTIYGYFGISVLYIAVLAIAGNFNYRPKIKDHGSVARIAVLIPGYKEDEVIVEVASDALRQEYHQKSYEVFVIADSFDQRTVDKLAELPVQVIPVHFENSTKAKSINFALHELSDRDFELAVILDADNVMAPDFLKYVNRAFQNGYKAIQGHRTAKNKNTPFAVLDAANEEINNHFFRKAHRVLGMSSGLIGSAMAFEINYFREIMSSINDVAGEDKEIELKILKDKVTIEYLEDAYVYDEKVQNAQVFSRQRTRWIASQVYYFKNYMMAGIRDLILKGNIDFFDKAFQTFIPPRILMLGALTFLTAGAYFIKIWPGFEFWAILLAANVFSLFVALPFKFYNKDLLRALINIPKAFFYMLKALFSIKGADKKFIHTPHTSSDNLKP
ncbi:glycosyltransferase family 2 protein [Fulvivirgaceae bacterium BMA12]|uniref:Glycosyltransferase family 2 protein n=1 Tax=Agaribacillus aureus TaxID=3051825 RepID=A0ABT8L1W2_9BACT|nr:glycosyltransferase family 2 protein [Fulvivirgaceae bacterium BMA12]